MARVARSELTEQQIEPYLLDLNGFLASGRKLQQLDAGGLAGHSHALIVGNVLPPDQLGESLPQAAVLAEGPEVMDGYFKVPRTVEGQE